MAEPCTDCTWDELGINVSFCPIHDAIARAKMNECIREYRKGKAEREAAEPRHGKEKT